MNKLLKWMLVLAMVCALAVVSVSADPLTAPIENEDDVLEIDRLSEYREEAWQTWVGTMMEDEQMLSETAAYAMTFGEATMRYTVAVIGEEPENGYPLYIAMHGGGYGETPDDNDEQWEDMQEYYSDVLETGVYVAVRGVRDTWDTHFNPESYPLYDRLIEYMILTENVDPNRVYLEGFSAGGDGVYAIGARMADRFAASNMSSGHPNGISMINYCHLPITLQAGEWDDAYDRNTVTAQYGLILDALQAEFPDGYEHRTLIHAERGHNYEDYDRILLPVYSNVAGWLDGSDRSTEPVDSFPPDWMDQFTRNPIPETLRWDLSTRAELRETEAFYYLSADKDAQGIIQVARDGNDIRLFPQDFSGDFMIYFNEDMIDFNEPVHFTIDGAGDIDVILVPESQWLMETTFDRGDPNYQFEAAVSYRWIMSQLGK